MKKKLISVICIIAIFVASAMMFVFYRGHAEGKEYRINLTENGFMPEDITISRGDTVIFSTSRDKPFWPASDLHPTHMIYPEFDPKEPIDADKSWTFEFDKAGEWKYHDHLSPLFRGMIRVTERSNSDAGSESADIATGTACESDDYGKKTACWAEIIYAALKSKGIDAAFERVSAFSQKDPRFAGDCHGIAHRIGESAFSLFSGHESPKLSRKTAYCAYGFYHGFMEALLHAKAPVKEAQAFCDYVQDQLQNQTIDGRGACYHGIGHGAVEDQPNPKSWGNAQAIIAPSLDICEQVAESNKDYLFRCTSGVFNALEIISTQEKYGLSLNQKDPFLICRNQPEKYKEACYTQLLVAAMNVAHSDFLKTARFVDTIKETPYAAMTLAGLAVERVRLGMTDREETIKTCRSLSARFHIPCITGFAEGFLKYGPPTKEYEGAIAFCDSALLTREEHAACFERVLSILRIWYTKEKSQTICESVPEEYRWNKCAYQ